MEHVAAVTEALDFIERNLRDEISVGDVAAVANYSTSHFHHLFASMTGKTLADYVRMRRLSCAALSLAFSRQRVIDIALEYRFESQEAFTRAFKRLYGVTPGAFRRGPEYANIITRLGIHRTMGEVRRRTLGGGEGFAVCETAAHEGFETGREAVSDARLDRRILSGVPRVGFYSGGDQCPEDISFPSCLAAALRYLGEDYPWFPVHMHRTDWRLNGAFVEMMAASGMAFSLLWREGWHQDNADLMFIADPREVVRRAFQHAGYSYEFLEKRGGTGDEEAMQDRIVASVDSGRPVLAFGVIGPPECCLITGYDNGGKKVIGWNYFQNESPAAEGTEFEPEGSFRKSDWFKKTIGAVMIGEKQPRADQAERLYETLRWAVNVATTPRVYGRHSGFRAYEAWAAELLDESAFLTDDVDVLRQRHLVHEISVSNVAECRWYAHMFLRESAKVHPGIASDLQDASMEYDQEHTLMWKAWDTLGGNGYPQAHLKFAEPELRRQLAALIRTARECDERAVGHLEKALRR